VSSSALLKLLEQIHRIAISVALASRQPVLRKSPLREQQIDLASCAKVSNSLASHSSRSWLRSPDKISSNRARRSPAGICTDEVGTSKNRDDQVTALLDRLASAFLSIH
jgi:hypothetical protein